jgi:hypothetical protein
MNDGRIARRTNFGDAPPHRLDEDRRPKAANLSAFVRLLAAQSRTHKEKIDPPLGQIATSSVST